MNHAFLIQCHAYPQLVELLIRKLMAPNHYFFIHVDGKTKNYEDFLKLSSDHVFFTSKRFKVHWGAEEQIYLTLELIRTAICHMSFDYFHLISGQDLPIVSNSIFDNFFEKAAEHNQSFMELDEKTKISDRFMLYHCNKLCNVRKSILGVFFEKRVVNWQRKVSTFFSLRKKISLRPYKGNNWWSLNKRAINYVIEYCRSHPNYIRRFRFTSCCDEVFFHTILFNSPLCATIVLDDLRYVDWAPSRPNESLPRILLEEDYDRIKRTNKIFMRKIDLIKSSSLIKKIYGK